MEVTITTENFESYKNGDLPLVVDLWATSSLNLQKNTTAKSLSVNATWRRMMTLP